MIFTAYVDGQPHPVEVPEGLPEEASDFFSKMDQDMDQGYQMSREWVQDMGLEKRCQVAADKLLTALHTERENIAQLMAAYIMARMPGVTGAVLDITGDMTEHDFIRE